MAKGQEQPAELFAIKPPERRIFNHACAGHGDARDQALLQPPRHRGARDAEVNILLRNATLFANINLLQVGRGAGVALPNPAERGPQMQGITKAMYDNATKAAKYATWQFRLFVAGAALYIVWHALEMHQRG